MPANSVLHTFVQYLIAFCSRPKADSDIVLGNFVRMLVRDKTVKFRDHRLNRPPEIRPVAVGGGIFDRF